ncbi:MAG: iron-containing alcohol dehydrogenase [Sporomusaceae bacterium]|nr:iron-containing alcohol dehydrogenase [Sporomusaceae bacterium]
MQWFRIPKDIVFGAGSLSYLAELQGKKAVVVTGGSSMKKFGFLQKTVDLLVKAGMEVQVIDGVEPDPSVKTVYDGAKVMQAFQPDWIVAVGGGSAIDAAKAMWVFYEHPQLTFPDIIKPFGIPKLRGKANFAAIPSTSGTASEVTCASVITDYDTPNKLKYPLLSYEITPDIAIVDPDLTVSMPPHVTAHTGVDALTHAIEAYVSTNSSHFTNPLALEAIKLVFEYLPKAYANGRDMEARGKMHYAQCLAGIAFTNAFLGIVHSMAHKIGAQFSIPHGEANAILLPHVIAYNAKTASKTYGEIARYIGIGDPDDAKATERLIAAVKQLNSQVGIPASLQEAGINEAEFLTKLAETAANALEDPCTGCNPRTPDVSDIEAIYKAAFKG